MAARFIPPREYGAWQQRIEIEEKCFCYGPAVPQRGRASCEEPATYAPVHVANAPASCVGQPPPRPTTAVDRNVLFAVPRCLLPKRKKAALEALLFHSAVEPPRTTNAEYGYHPGGRWLTQPTNRIEPMAVDSAPGGASSGETAHSCLAVATAPLHEPTRPEEIPGSTMAAADRHNQRPRPVLQRNATRKALEKTAAPKEARLPLIAQPFDGSVRLSPPRVSYTPVRFGIREHRCDG